jgi:AcrR family transcriptional regulator
VGVVAQDGYPQAKIGDLAARAGVSRATFYELFTDKEECFLAAHRELAERMSAEVGEAVAQSDPVRAAQAALTALVSFADREPLAFSFLTHEAMLAGPRALQERDRLIAQLEGHLERAWGQAPDSAPMPDVPASILLGGAIRLLGIRMRRGQDHREQLLADLIEWVDCYSVPRRAHRWRSITAGAGPLDARQGTAPGPVTPQPLPRGRHRLPVAMVKRVQRERILHATAQVIRAKSYANITVADIVATAGVSREVFYSHFHSRREAFTDTHNLVFEQIMASTASAFLSSWSDWPEQVWESGRAFTEFFVAASSFAHFAFVESYALGPAGALRTDDAILAFTVFLEEGHRYRRQATRLPALIAEAIAAAVMETAAFYVRHGSAEELLGLLPLITYVILAPFTGTDAAREFVEGKLGETQAEHSPEPSPIRQRGKQGDRPAKDSTRRAR